MWWQFENFYEKKNFFDFDKFSDRRRKVSFFSTAKISKNIAPIEKRYLPFMFVKITSSIWHKRNFDFFFFFFFSVFQPSTLPSTTPKRQDRFRQIHSAFVENGQGWKTPRTDCRSKVQKPPQTAPKKNKQNFEKFRQFFSRKPQDQLKNFIRIFLSPQKALRRCGKRKIFFRFFFFFCHLRFGPPSP